MYLTTLIGGRRETNALENGSYMIGRSASCRLCLPFPDVSERHAVLTVRDGRAVLEDLHSANGTYVNGRRIDRKERIFSGDVITMGGVDIVFSKDMLF